MLAEYVSANHGTFLVYVITCLFRSNFPFFGGLRQRRANGLVGLGHTWLWTGKDNSFGHNKHSQRRFLLSQTWLEIVPRSPETYPVVLRFLMSNKVAYVTGLTSDSSGVVLESRSGMERSGRLTSL